MHNVHTCASLPRMKRHAMKPRSIRVETSLWQAAQDKATERGETVSAFIRRALVAYVKLK